MKRGMHILRTPPGEDAAALLSMVIIDRKGFVRTDTPFSVSTVAPTVTAPAAGMQLIFWL